MTNFYVLLQGGRPALVYTDPDLTKPLNCKWCRGGKKRQFEQYGELVFLCGNGHARVVQEYDTVAKVMTSTITTTTEDDRNNDRSIGN